MSINAVLCWFIANISVISKFYFNTSFLLPLCKCRRHFQSCRALYLRKAAAHVATLRRFLNIPLPRRSCRLCDQCALHCSICTVVSFVLPAPVDFQGRTLAAFWLPPPWPRGFPSLRFFSLFPPSQSASMLQSYNEGENPEKTYLDGTYSEKTRTEGGVRVFFIDALIGPGQTQQKHPASCLRFVKAAKNAPPFRSAHLVTLLRCQECASLFSSAPGVPLVRCVRSSPDHHP